MNDALIISGLTKTYKDFMLNGVSFSVPCGSIVGLIGENGAGKSTTINAVLGLIQKEAGSICVLGKSNQITKSRNRLVSYLTATTILKSFLPENSTGL